MASSHRASICLAKLAEGACGGGYPICKRCWPLSSEADREAIKAEYNVGKDQPFCIAAACWQMVRLSGEARDANVCHTCYNGPAHASDPSRHTRDDTRSRSPVLIPVRRSAPSSSSTDNVADLVAEVRQDILLWRRQAAAMRATADRLEEIVLKIDSERVA